MEFERTKSGEVVALARLLGVKEVRLLVNAAEYQPNIKCIEDINDRTYEILVANLTRYAELKADGTVESYDQMLGEEGLDDDEFDLEKQMDKWEVQYLEECRRDAEARAERYRDYCERKYGWDCS